MAERELAYIALALAFAACALLIVLLAVTLSRKSAQRKQLDALEASVADMLTRQDGGLYRALDTLSARIAATDTRQEERLARMDARFTQLTGENARQLEEMRRTVDEKLSETLGKRLGDSFSMVAGRLEQLYKGMGEMQKLAGGVDDLKRVLGNVKTRGTWGEVQLGALLGETLASNQYERNVMVRPGSGERVEFAVRLPGMREDAPLYLPIDSKFPMADYERLTRCEGEAAEKARAALMNAVRVEAKRISEKYIDPPHTTDFAVMFLPTESLYAEVLAHMTDMSDLQARFRVVVAGPSTLSALLNSLQMGFRSLAIEKRSGEVWALLGAVKGDFLRFTDLLVKAQERLTQATDSLDSAAKQTRRLQRRLRDVEELDAPRIPNSQDNEGE